MIPEDLQRQIELLADGELSPAEQTQLERLLEQRPDLRAALTRCRALRDCACRAVSSEPVPADLAQRVCCIWRAPESAESPAVTSSPTAPAGRAPLRYRRRWVARLGLPGMAVAAAVVLAVVFVPGHASATPVEASSFAQIFRRCAQMHRHDAYECRGHTLAEAETKLAAAGRPGVRIPDLTKAGYELDGVCACAPADSLRVVHAYYRRPAAPDDVVSVFLVDRCVDLRRGGACCPKCCSQQREYCGTTEDGITVLCWRQGGSSFVLCGAMERPELRKIADQVQTGCGGCTGCSGSNKQPPQP